MATNQYLFGPLAPIVRVLVLVLTMVVISDVLPRTFSDHGTIVYANGSGIRNTSQTFQWNLGDQTKPLLNFSDHLGGGNMDLALTYSLDRFELPLLQTLYFNQRVGKYLVLVISGPQRRAEFIELSQQTPSQFIPTEKLDLRLKDNDSVKLLAAGDGTVYTFRQLADGEFHCNRIDDLAGSVIKLNYSSEALLNTIADQAGRMVAFAYDGHHLKVIAQTWSSPTAKMVKTWAISDHKKFQASSDSITPIGPIVPKTVPSNAMTPGYTRQMETSDICLAALFGGSGAVAAANGFEPRRLANRYPLYRGDFVGDDGKVRRGHLSFAMHLYGSEDGTGETELYVPAGFTSHSGRPSATDAAVIFYYPRLGDFKNVTLAVFHVANFRLVPEGSRVRIGSIGGRGGSIATYRHSHFEFYRGDTGLPRVSLRARLRIDPASIFTSNTGARARAN